MMCRIEFDESAGAAEFAGGVLSGTTAGTPAAASAHADCAGDSRNDLAMVEDLLDRCWREVDASSLNVKLADIVRLLEFKNKLRSAADAEQTFWTMINEMRREELDRFGVVETAPETSDPSDADESEIPSATV